MWAHDERQAIFVGDLIDRGPEQIESVRIAQTMVEAGSAQIVLGNHEFNAIAYATPDVRATTSARTSGRATGAARTVSSTRSSSGKSVSTPENTTT